MQLLQQLLLQVWILGEKCLQHRRRLRQQLLFS